MIKEFYLSRFTPSLDDPETLEAIFVQREELAARLVELIRESVLTGNKHYSLLVGPRGIGKTHLVSLVCHRVSAEADLEDRLRVAWLREEECVVSFLDFLQTILSVLQEKYGDERLGRECEQLSGLSIEEAELRAEQLLLQTVGNGTLLLIAENLDEIFRGLGKQGQEKLRALIQNHPVFTILATSQSLFSGVSVRKSPFYGFFDTHHLQELTFEDAVTMMTKIARHQENEELASLIQRPRGRFRVRAVHHLAGGNPRVYVIFSQLVTCESLDDLVEPVLRTLDDLTPYYQDRMRHLSPQQQKIVDYLCQRRHAVSVGEIARDNRVTHQTASSQLKKLREMGYVRADQAGRESYYELREPLMRISRDAKKFRGKSIRLLVAFLRNWYSHAELADRLDLLKSKTDLHREDLQRPIETVVQEPDDPRLAACLRDYKESVTTEDIASALEVAEELAETRGYASDWMRRAKCLRKLDREDAAKQSEKRALKFEPNTAEGWQDRACILCHLERHDEALTCVDKLLDLGIDDVPSWRCRGSVLDRLRRYEEALASVQKCVQLDPSDAINWRNQARALRRLKRYEEALASLDKAIELGLNDVATWRFAGRLLDELKRYEDALTSYDKAIKLDPNDGPTWACRAHSLHHLDRHHMALESCDKATKVAPDDVMAWRFHGYLLERIKRYDEAVASYGKANELAPDDAFVWQSRGFCLFNTGRFEEALASVDRALEIEPNGQGALELRVIILYRLGRREESLAALEELLELDPDDYNAWSNRAVALSSLGRHEEAITSFDRSLELASVDFEFHVRSNRAVVLAMLGRWDEGVRALDDTLHRFAEEGGVDVRGEVAIVRNMLVRTQEVATWRRHIATWIELFDKHGVLSALGHGLVRSVPTLGISWIGDEVARAWRDVWQELGRAYPELEIPLRLLDAAVRYREKPDVRVLLGLPIEERELLKPLLGLRETSEEETIADTSV